MDAKICLIVILYNPSEEIIHRLCRYNAEMIIVDNTPEVNITYSDRLNAKFRYISLADNRGIACAQNVAIQKAKELGFDYVIFFDQDSEYDIAFVEKMIEEYKEIKRQDPFIATLGPAVVDKDTNLLYKSESSSDKLFSKVETVISSGSVVETAVFDVVGGLEERLFIDLVDHEWCWRAKSFGYNCYQTSRVVLPHKVGNCSKTFFGYPIILSSPIRYYYKYRNFIWMLSRRYVPLRWKINGLIRKIVELFCVPVLAKDFRICRYMLKGIKDGFVKK